MYREGDEGRLGGLKYWLRESGLSVICMARRYRGYMVLISKAESVTGDPATVPPRVLLLPKMVQLRELSNKKKERKKHPSPPVYRP